MANDKRRQVYDMLVQRTGYQDTYDDFNTLIDDPAKRRKVYDMMVERTGYQDTYDEFDKFIRPVEPQYDSNSTDTATSPVPLNKASNEGQKGWLPSPMQKAAMIAEIHSGVDKTIGNMQGSVDKVRRLVESNTDEGRNKRKAAEMQARMVGTPVRVPGLTADTNSSATGNESGNQGNPNSPIPYGVKMENGEAKTEWLLPDGSLSTSLIDADNAEFGARKARLQHEFVKRMEENGLDPVKKSDIEEQRKKDLLDVAEIQTESRLAENEEHLHKLYDERAWELDQQREWNDDEGFWSNFVRIVGGAANRSVTINAPKRPSSTAEDMAIGTYLAENQILTDARKLLETRKLNKSDGFMGGFWNIGNNWRNMKMGAKHTLSDSDYYLNGVMALQKASRLMKIEDKLKQGAELTDAEVSLVYSTALGQEVQSNTDIPHGYTVAQIELEMFPFMAQMALNPASGLSRAMVTKFGKSGLRKIAMKKAAQGLTEEAAAQFAKRETRKLAAKAVGVQVAGDVAESAVLANTLQGAKTAADAMERYQGNVVINDNGIITFDGNHNWAEAIYKAEASATIENYTEMLGEHFGIIGNAIGKGAGKGLRAIGGGKVVDTVSDMIAKIGTNEWGKAISAVEKRAHWNGTVGEVLEEEAGIVLNSIFTGDNKISDLWDADQQIDIVLGVGLFGGFMSGLKTVGYPIGKSKAKGNLRKSDSIGAWRFGDGWTYIRDEINNAEEKDLGNVVRDLVRGHAKSDEQGKAIVEYAHALMNSRGYEIASASARSEGTSSPEQQDIEESFEHGEHLAETEVPQEMNDAKRMLDLQRQRLASALSEDVVHDFDTDPIGALSRTADPDTRLIAADYVNAKAVYDGMIQRVRDDIDGRIAQSDAMIDGRVNRTTGMIHPATMRSDGKETQVYVVDGEIAMFEDGSGIDTQNSSESIIIRDAETGKIEFADPTRLVRVDNGIDAETEKEAVRQQIRQEVAQAAANKIDGVLSFTPGDIYNVLDMDGQPQEVSIVGQPVDENGVPVEGQINIQYPDGQIQQVAMSDLQQQVDAANAQRVENFVSENAETVPNIAENAENPTINGENPSENVPKSENLVGNVQQSALSRIPMDDNGGYRFDVVDPETAWDGMVEFMENEDDASEYAAAMVGESEAAVKKAEQAITKVKPTNDPAKFKADKAAARSALSEAQRQMEHWQNVVGVASSRRAAIEEAARQQAEAERAAQIAAEARREAELQAEARRKAEEDAAAPREYAKAYAGWEQPATFEEYVLRRLSAAGMKLKWGKNERTGTNGLGAMLGYGSGTREQQGLLWLLDNANGYYPEEAAERMLVDFKAETGMEPNIDAMDAHNTLLDVIATHGTSRAMWAEAKRRHDAMEATAPVDEEYERQREWYETRFGMSPEEYESYEELVYSDIAAHEISEDEMSDFIATFADAILTEQKEREEYERNGEHDNSAAGSLRERGDGILPEERPDIAAGDNPLVQRPQEADGNGNRPDGGTPQEKLSKEEAADIIAKMEMSAIDDPRIDLSPESWLQSFGLNNSIETPMGKVKMGDGQYQKFIDKKRSNEFGMVVQTLQDPDIVFIEPSEAKEGQIAERNFSYVFVKTFIRDGKKLKYYTSVSVLKDGMEVSVSSHIASKTAILKKLESMERAYTKESLLPNSSEWHLAEHPTDVPDLLPTQGKSETIDDPTLTDANHLVTPISDLSEVSEDKITESSAEKQAEPAESSMNERIAAAEAEVNTNPTDAQKAAGNYKKGHVQVGTFDVTIENPAGSVRSGVDTDGKPWSNTMHNTYGYIRGTVGVDGDHIDVYLSSNIDGWNGRRVFVMDVYNPDGTFDEHKVMLGFNEKEEAAFEFAANYDIDWVKARRIEIHSVTLDDFEKWIESSKRKTKPFGEYAIAKKSDENNSISSKAEAAQPIFPEKAADKLVNPSGNRLVSDERYAEIRERMRKKLGGQLNMGIDPEILAIGTEMAVYHIERGARKFATYASAMIADLGDIIRPYLKSFYNAVRDMPEAETAGLIADMDSYDDVRRVDIANFDKPNTDAMATAAAIVSEQEADNQRAVAEKKLKEKRKKRSKAESKSTTDGGLFDNLPYNSLSSQTEATLIHYTNERTDVQARAEESGRGRQQPRPDEPLGEGAEHEDERTYGRGVARRGGVHPVPDAGRSSGVSRLSEGAERISDNAPKNSRNNHVERGADYAPKGEKTRIDANITAIGLAKRLLESGTPATPEDMAVLRRYSGWGGLGSAFNEGSTWSPNPVNKRLRELLTPEEYDAAVMSRNSAYYTPAPVIDAMWDIAKALGFKGGNIMEGSAGIGNIIGLMPADISERSSVHAVEVEPLTGGILSLLYPDANVEVQGFEQTRIPNGSVDLAITNVPFVPGLRVSDESGDSDLSKKFRDIHDFCIAKNVRKLREGGIGIFITTRTTLDDSQKLRNWIVGDKEGCADVVGVFRMHNQTFGGTPATSDIIVVRKRVNGRRSDNAIDVSTRTLARTTPYEDENGKTKELPMLINRYFIEHPECMGGEMFFNFEQGDTFRPKSIGLFQVRDADQLKRMAAWVKSLSEKDWSKE